MKKAVLNRGESTDQGTFGFLSFNGKMVFTVELPWRDNLPQKSCIPKGSYTCAIVNSPKFGRVYGVQNVQGRSNVLIHSANFAGNSDLGYTTELHGCISVGNKIGYMRNRNGKMQKAVLISRPALNILNEWANGNPFTLVIENEFS